MDSIPGLSEILKEVLTKCGFLQALSIAVATFFIVRSARIQGAWEKDRGEATKRLDTANETILKLVESSNKADAEVAVALKGVETMLVALQVRRGSN